ncbi:prepilin-type N-terminal cleavage/methylation domain-containing protein [Aquitalea sp. S1-19]|nr:prepilin-type N-terminal cleavage/methylation domain-containing protein [Aquitalea sp. S1-19]
MMQKRCSQGFSLIEFMVALGISLLALLAVSELYLNSRQTSRLQQMQNVLSEEGRFAMSMLQRIVSQAGFHPVTSAGLVNPVTANSAASLTVAFTQQDNNMLNCSGNTAVAGNHNLTIAAANNMLTCTAGGAAIPWIAPVVGGQGVELVDFNLSYGVDTGPATDPAFGCGDMVGGNRRGDCIADNYQVPAVGAAAQLNIRTVKACFVLRTATTDSSVVKRAAVTNCAGADIAGSQNDQRLYRLYRTTILLKNR